MKRPRILFAFILILLSYFLFMIHYQNVVFKEYLKQTANIKTDYSSFAVWEYYIEPEIVFEPTTSFNTFQEKITESLHINKDVIGWINISNTVIDYPVLRTNNNDYYLHHNIYGNRSSYGSIFMDYRNKGDASDKHNILYGHSMNNGTMFKAVLKYKNKDFFYENNIIRFDTVDEEYEWEVFSAYVVNPNAFYYIITDFNNDEYKNFLNKIIGLSIHKTDVVVTEDDKILTLSTCSYEFDDARFVVHAKRIN